MPRLIPPNVELPAALTGDPRVGHLIGNAEHRGAGASVAIVGFPYDEGVSRNGGRPGAAGAPAQIRSALYRLTPDAEAPEPFAELLRHTKDLGDLEIAGDLDRDQASLAEVIAPYLEAGTFVIVIGGGHETAYGHFLGYVRAGLQTRIVNVDAHADVRPLRDGLGHSGSPFRQAVEHVSGACTGYSVAGLLPQAVSAEHLAFVQRHGERVWSADVTTERMRELYDGGTVMASFDIDAVDQSFAPGVSAPAVSGLHSRTWLEAARMAGRSSAVKSLDVVETNPVLDRDSQTVRLAALTVWQVLRGVAERI